jgi:hypothetical protein
MQARKPVKIAEGAVWKGLAAKATQQRKISNMHATWGTPDFGQFRFGFEIGK